MLANSKISGLISSTNPWAGKGFVEDIKPEILEFAPKLGDILVPELIKEIGSGDKIQAYGKAAIVGLNGEIEHASAFIHTLRFGNKFRDAVGGTAYLSFTNTRGPAGSKISIPMMHKKDPGLRPFYLTHEFISKKIESPITTKQMNQHFEEAINSAPEIYGWEYKKFRKLKPNNFNIY